MIEKIQGSDRNFWMNWSALNLRAIRNREIVDGIVPEILFKSGGIGRS